MTTRASSSRAEPARRRTRGAAPSAPQGEPVFFDSPAAFRRWLHRHHSTAGELLVGYHKRATGKPSMTWAESVDEALCYGWIDGVRRSYGPDAYTIRFTPRRKGSIWSAVNLRNVERLIATKRMQPAGLRVFEERDPRKTNLYSFERKVAVFPKAMEREFRANRAAWAWWSAQAPYYKRAVTHWVTSAKREATRESRFRTLVADCAAGRRVKGMRRKGDE